jgi:hypothetical protein
MSREQDGRRRRDAMRMRPTTSALAPFSLAERNQRAERPNKQTR